MAIRSELLSPAYHVVSANAYLMVVGEHGTMMMMPSPRCWSAACT